MHTGWVWIFQKFEDGHRLCWLSSNFSLWSSCLGHLSYGLDCSSCAWSMGRVRRNLTKRFEVTSQQCGDFAKHARPCRIRSEYDPLANVYRLIESTCFYRQTNGSLKLPKISNSRIVSITPWFTGAESCIDPWQDWYPTLTTHSGSTTSCERDTVITIIALDDPNFFELLNKDSK